MTSSASPVSNHTCPLPGLPDDLIQKRRDIKGISEIVHNGNHVKMTLTYGPKVFHNEFTLGEECELETMSGEKVKVWSPTSCFPKVHLTETMSLNLVQAGDTESSENRLLIASGIMRRLGSHHGGCGGNRAQGEILNHRVSQAQCSWISGVLQGEPRTGANRGR